MRNSLVSVVSLLVVSAASCVPTASRTNAKLEPGAHVGLVGGVQVIGEGETESGETTESSSVAHAEIDIEWAHVSEDQSGFAVQLKVPSSIVFTTLDLYYALPSAGETYFGFGTELGALPGIYAAATQYIDDSFFVTFTPKVLFAKSNREKAFLVNPQIALGMTGAVEISGFISFVHHTGQGFDFDIDLFSDTDRKDYRKRYWLTGVSLRF